MANDVYGNKIDANLLAAKAANIGKATNTKQARFSGSDLAMDLEQFRTAYPQANALQERAFLNRKANLNQGMFEDVQTDLGIAADKFQQLGGNLVGLVGIDSGWDYANEQQEEIDAAKSNYSAALQESNELIQAGKDARKAQQMGDGNISTGEAVGDFFSTAGDYITNPRSIVSDAVQSVDSLAAMVVGGGVGGAIGKTLAKRAAGKAIAAGTEAAAAKATIQAAGKAGQLTGATVAGDVLTGVMEGGHNAKGTYDALLALEPEVLNTSEDFQALQAANPDASFEDLRQEFALSGARDTGLISGVIAAAIGKGTGASKALSGATIGGTAKQSVTKGALKEAGEEVLQSGSGEAISNIQIKEGDKSKDILEDVASAAAAGGLSGGLTGAAIPSVGRTVDKLAGTTGDVVKAVAKAVPAKKVETVVGSKPIEPDELHNKQVEIEDSFKELETELESGDPTTKAIAYNNALAKVSALVAMHGDVADPKRQEELGTTLDSMSQQMAEYKQKVVGTPQEAEERVTAASQNMSAMSAEESSDIKNIVQFSPESISPEQAKALALRDSDLDERTTKVLDSIALGKATPKDASMEDVVDNIYNNSVNGFTSLKDYTESVYSTFLSDDTESTGRLLGSLERFAGSHAEKARLLTAAKNSTGSVRAEHLAEYNAKFNPNNNPVSMNLAPQLQAESDAISQTLTNLQSLTGSKAPVSTPKSTKGKTEPSVSKDGYVQQSHQENPQLVTGGNVFKPTPAEGSVQAQVQSDLVTHYGVTPEEFKEANNIAYSVPKADRTSEQEAIVSKVEVAIRDGNKTKGVGATKPKEIKALLAKYPESKATTLVELMQWASKGDNKKPSKSTPTKGTEGSDTKPVTKKTAVPEVKPTPEPEGKTEPEVTTTSTLVQPAKATTEGRGAKLKSTQIIEEYFTADKQQVVNQTTDVTEMDDTSKLPEDFFIERSLEEGSVNTGVTEVHTKGMSNFFDKVKGFFYTSSKQREQMEKGIGKGSVEFGYNDYSRHLLNADGSFPDHIWAGISSAMLSYLAEDAKGTLYNSDSKIRKLLKLGDSDFIPYAAQTALRRGITLNQLEDTLGQRAAKALGLKAKNTVDQYAQERLEKSLGYYMAKAMVDAGQMNNKKVSVNNLSIWSGNTPEANANAVVDFVSYKETDATEALIEAEKEAGNIIGNLFNASENTRKPFFSKKELEQHTPKKMKGTSRLVPKRMQKILDKHTSKSFVMKQDKYNLLVQMSPTEQARLFGYMTTEEIAELPFYKRDSQKAVNDALLLSLDNLHTFVAEMKSRSGGYFTEFYIPHEVYRNLRVGMKSKTVNPQADKIHRHLMGLASELTSFSKVDPSKAKKNFFLAIALGMGVKVDKQTDITSLNQIMKTIQENPIVGNALDAISKLKKNESTPALQEAVRLGVIEGGEAAFSYEALVELEAYMNHAGTEPFSTSIISESDGITNGPSISLFYNSFSNNIQNIKDRLSSAGFFFDNSSRSFGEYKESSALTLDMYENLVKITAENMKDLPTDLLSVVEKYMGAMLNEDGTVTSAGRNFGKEPLVGNVYGQGDKSVKNYAGSYGLAKMLDALHKASDVEAFNEVKADIETLIKHNMDMFPDRKGVQKAGDQALIDLKRLNHETVDKEGITSQAIIDSVSNVYAETYGVGMIAAIGSDFEGIKEKSSPTITGITGSMDAFYQGLLHNAIQAKTTELAEAGELVEGAESLTKPQVKEVEAELASRFPTMSNYFSESNVDALTVGKSRRATKGDKDVPEVKNKPLNIRVPADIGVSAVAPSVHSLDSTIMMLAIENLIDATGKTVTNIYDAVLGGTVTIDQATTALNEATLEVLKTTHPLVNLVQGMRETFAGITSDNIQDQGLDLEQLEKVGAPLATMAHKLNMSVGDTTITTDMLTTAKKYVVDNNLMYNEEDTKAFVEGMDSLLESEETIEDFHHLAGLLPDMFTADGNLKPVVFKMFAGSPELFLSAMTNRAEELAKEGRANTDRLLEDLTYLVQYNKEGSGIDVVNGKVVPLAVESNAAFETAIMDAATEYTTSEPEVPAPVVDTFTDSLLFTKNSELVNAVVDAPQLSNGGSLVTAEELLTLGKDLLSPVTVELINATKDHTEIHVMTAGNKGALLDYLNGKDYRVSSEQFDHILGTAIDGGADQKTVVVLMASVEDYDGNVLTGINNETIKHELSHSSTSIFINGIYAEDVALRKHLQSTLKTPQRTLLPIKEQMDKLYKEALSKLPKAILTSRPDVFSTEYSLAYRMNEFMAQGTTNTPLAKELNKIKVTKGKSIVGHLKALKERMYGLLTKGKFEGKNDSVFSELVRLNSEMIQWNDTTQVLNQQKQQGNNSNFTQGMQAMSADHIKREQEVNQENAVELLKEMELLDKGNVSVQEVSRLQRVVEGLTARIINPLKLNTYTNASGWSGVTVKDKLDISRQDAEATANTNNLDRVFNLSMQEGYTYQLVRTAVDSGVNDFGWKRKELGHAYMYARKHLSPEHFLDSGVRPTDSDYTNQLAKATYKYNAIFSPKENKGKSHYLHDFAALTEASTEFRELLAGLPPISRKPTQFFSVDLVETITNIVNFIGDMFTKKYRKVALTGSALDVSETLVKQMIRVELENKSMVLQMSSALLNKTAGFAAKVGVFTDDHLKAAFAKLPASVQKRNVLEQARRGTSLLTRNPQAKYVGSVISQALGSVHRGMPTFTSALANEVRQLDAGRKGEYTGTENVRFYRLQRENTQAIDKFAQSVRENTHELLDSKFSTSPDRTSRMAVTKALIQTDIATLAEQGYSLNQLINLVGSNIEVKQEIEDTLKQLRSLVIDTQHMNYYDLSAKALGNFMATGLVTSPNNVTNITRLYRMDGTSEVAQTLNQDKIVKLLDKLATLHAVDNTSESVKRSAVKVMQNEAKLGQGNGIEFMLSSHQTFKEDALEKQFRDNPDDMVKGYIPDILDPRVDVTVSSNPADEELLRQGYKLERELATDKDDPNVTRRYMYVHPNAGLAGYVQGIAYLSSKQAKGTSLLDSRYVTGSGMPTYAAARDLQDMKRDKSAAIQAMFNGIMPPKTATQMLPSFHTDGTIKDYRYVMSHTEKDTLLNRDTDFLNVLPKYIADNHVVPSTQEANTKLIKAMKEQYDIDKEHNNLVRYVTVSSKASDKRARDAWNTFPYEMQELIKKTYGKAELPVRNDLFDLILGNREIRIKDLWSGSDKERSSAKKLATTILDTVTFGKAKYMAPKIEQAVIEAGVFVSDIIVNKSGVVLLNNILSNNNFLIGKGLSSLDAMKWQYEAIRNAKQYSKDYKRRAKLAQEIATTKNPSLRRKYEQEIKVLVDSIKRNPVLEYIEAGLLPNISEGEITTTDVFSYKSNLMNKVDTGLDKLPTSMKSIVNQLAMSHETSLYQFLNSATGLSDFASKVALIKHQTSKEGITKEGAIDNASVAFVNYDAPTHAILQYMNSIKVLWFARYSLRIQKEILKSLAEKPSRIAVLVALSMVVGAPTVFGSLFIFGKNPLDLFGFLDRFTSGAGLHPVVGGISS